MIDAPTSEWRMESLTEVCDFKGGTQPPKSTFLYQPKAGYVRLLQIRDYSSDEHATFIRDEPGLRKCDEDDVLLGRYGASVGKVLRGKSGAYNVAICKVIPDETKLTKDFLHLYLQSREFQSAIVNLGDERGVQAGFNKSDLAAFEIPVPPLAEQRRLVARIEALTSRLEQARQARQAALADAETLIHSVRHEEFAKLLATQPTRPLGRCGRVLGGGTPSKANPEFWRGKIPWVTAKEMWNYEVVDSQLKISEAAMKASPVKLIPANSVLFVVRGSILFKRVPVAVNRVVCTINQDMKAIVPDDEILGDYLAHMMWAANEELRSLVDTAGNSAGKLETDKWSAVQIPIPKSTDEQRRIVTRLDALSAKQTELRRLQTETEAELAAFTPALLAKAFKGEL